MVECLDLHADPIKLALPCLRPQVIGGVVIKGHPMVAHRVLLLHVLDQAMVLNLLLCVVPLQVLDLLVSLSYLCFKDGRIVDKATFETLF